MDELVKELNASTKEVQALDSAIKAIQDDPDNINYSDILGLAEAHPELLTVIGDSKALLEMLQAIRAEAGNNQRGIFREMILGNEKTMAGSKYAESGFKTLGDYRKSLLGNAEALAAFDAEVEAWIAVLEKANEDFNEVLSVNSNRKRRLIFLILLICLQHIQKLLLLLEILMRLQKLFAI